MAEEQYKEIEYGGKTYRLYPNGTIRSKKNFLAKWRINNDPIIKEGVLKSGGQAYLDEQKALADEDAKIADATSAIPTVDESGNTVVVDARGLPPGYQEEYRVTVGSPEDQALQEHPVYGANRKVIGNTVVYTADAAAAWVTHNETKDTKLATDPDYVKNVYQNGGLSPDDAINAYAKAAGVSRLKARVALGIEAGEFGATTKGTGEGAVDATKSEGKGLGSYAGVSGGADTSPELDKYQALLGATKKAIADGMNPQEAIAKMRKEIANTPGYENYSNLKIRKDLEAVGVAKQQRGPLAGAVDATKALGTDLNLTRTATTGNPLAELKTGDLQGATDAIGLTHGAVTHIGDSGTEYHIGTKGPLAALPSFVKDGTVVDPLAGYDPKKNAKKLKK